MILDFKKFLNESYLAAQLLPSVSVTSEIEAIDLNKNPILITFKGNTKIYLSWDEYRRLKKPSVGQKLTVNFQQHPNVKTKELAQINYVQRH